MGQMKMKIRRFADQLSALASTGQPDEIYTMGIELYPLTYSVLKK
jgi:hypothetical protein